MRYLFTLSKQNIELSLFEALELFNIKKYELQDNYLMVGVNEKKVSPNKITKEMLILAKRLAYTNYVDEVLFECSLKNTDSLKDVEKKIKSFNWQEHYKTNFCVRTINIEHENEKKYAGIIWNKLKNPKVDLEKPKTLFVFIKAGKKIYATKLLWKNPKTFLERKAHLRPALHPSSLDPRLAKACVNIATAVKNVEVEKKKERTVLDPFCGSGGILIEAGLMGFHVIGYDIDKKMLEMAKTNLKHYGVKNYKLELHDALKLNKQKLGKEIDAIVTDIPYGLNTKPVNIDKLLKQFLKKSYQYTKQMVIAFPSTIKYKKYLGKWKLKKEFEYYIHKSLTKRIVVVER